MANIKDLSILIKNKIESYETSVSNTEEGVVISVADGIATVTGLSQVQYGELVHFETGVKGMTMELEEDFVGIIIFGDYSSVQEGHKVKRTKEIAEVPVGDNLIGRVVNPLGQPLDGGEEIISTKQRPIERVASGIMARESVGTPMQTGILAIDSLVPIGRGQRELIIGDRKTGKTAIALDAILNQKHSDVKCVYVSIGQKNSTLAVTTQKLIEAGAMDYTTIVAANAADSDAMQFIAPFAATAIAEEWMENGEDVLIIFDDLTKHAVAYRTVSLLLRRPPGREAYPGDVFYLHSRLLERAANITPKAGGGSITALPIVETQAGDISAYIPTNIISITDGQIFLLADQFNSGQRPAVDAGLSVSRVGGAAQTKLMKTQSGSLKIEIANYNEVKSFSQFASDLDAQTKKILNRGQKIMEFLKQNEFTPLPQENQAVILFSIRAGLIDDIKFEEVRTFKSNLIEEMNTSTPFKTLVSNIKKLNKISDKNEIKLTSLIKKVIKELN